MNEHDCSGEIEKFRKLCRWNKGGELKAGEWGIVGEYGPELVQGPMSITSRKETAEWNSDEHEKAHGYLFRVEG